MVDPLGGTVYWIPLGVAWLVGYLFGSIPFGLLIARFAGAGDVRQIGSGNIGATNVLRTGRKGLAVATLIADLLKSAVPVWLAYSFFGPDIAVMVGFGAVLGHCFPIWLGFRGGKGVATAAGVILALTPLVLVVALAAFAAAVWLTRYVSLGSVIASVVAPVMAYLMGQVQAAELYLVLGLVVIFLHRANIGRLLKGTENKLGG